MLLIDVVVKFFLHGLDELFTIRSQSASLSLTVSGLFPTMAMMDSFVKARDTVQRRL